MKAIQARYLGATNTKPSRIKVWAEGNPPTIHFINSGEILETQVRRMISVYCETRDWGNIYGFGCLPNGDYVATLGA